MNYASSAWEGSESRSCRGVDSLGVKRHCVSRIGALVNFEVVILGDR
jgi:hypothetical protein